jgi:hypothetical protein
MWRTGPIASTALANSLDSATGDQTHGVVRQLRSRHTRRVGKAVERYTGSIGNIETGPKLFEHAH